MLMKAGGSSVQEVRNHLAEAQTTYLTLLQQGNYPPGKQPLKEDTRVQALQAQVKSLTDKVGSLSRDPTATSTTGTEPSRGSDPDKKPTQSKYVAYKDRDPNGKAPNGLTNAECAKAKALIKECFKTMPENLATVPSSEEISISHAGKTLAKWCTHCNRFILGDKMHFTKDHKDFPDIKINRGKAYFVCKNPAYYNYKGQLKSDAPTAPAPAPAPAPVPAPDSAPPVTFQQPPVYDFSASEPLHRDGFLAATGTSEDDDWYDSVDPALLDLLSGRAHPKE